MKSGTTMKSNTSTPPNTVTYLTNLCLMFIVWWIMIVYASRAHGPKQAGYPPMHFTPNRDEVSLASGVNRATTGECMNNDKSTYDWNDETNISITSEMTQSMRASEYIIEKNSNGMTMRNKLMGSPSETKQIGDATTLAPHALTGYDFTACE